MGTMGRLDKSHRFHASTLQNNLAAFDSYGGTDDDTDSDEDGHSRGASYGGVQDPLDGSCDTLFFDDEESDGDEEQDDPKTEYVETKQVEDAVEAAEGTLEALVRLDREVHRRESIVGADQKKRKSKLKKIFKKKKKNKDKDKKQAEFIVESPEFEHLHQHTSEGSVCASEQQSSPTPQQQALVETCEAFGNLLSMMEGPRKKLPATADIIASPDSTPSDCEGRKSVAESGTSANRRTAHQKQTPPEKTSHLRTPTGSTRKRTIVAKGEPSDENDENANDKDMKSLSPTNSPLQAQATKRKARRRDSLYGFKQKQPLNAERQDDNGRRNRSQEPLSADQSGGNRRSSSNDPLSQGQPRGSRRNRSADPLGPSQHRGGTSRNASKEPVSSKENKETRRSRSSDPLGPSEHRGGARQTRSRDPLGSSQHREARRSRSNDPLGPSEHRKTSRRSSVEPRERGESRRSSSNDAAGSRESQAANRTSSSTAAVGSARERREPRRSNSNDPLGQSDHRGLTRRSSRDPLSRTEHRASRTRPLTRSNSLRGLESDDEKSALNRERVRGAAAGQSRKPQSMKRVSRSAGELGNMKSETRPSGDRNAVWTNAPNRRTNRRTSRMMTAAGIQLELESADESTGSGTRRRSLSRGDSGRRLRGVGRSRSFQDSSEAEQPPESVEELLRALGAPSARTQQAIAVVHATDKDSMDDDSDSDLGLDHEYIVPVKGAMADSDVEDYKPPPRPSSLGDLRDMNEKTEPPRRPGLLQRMESVGSFFGKGRGNVGAGLQALSPQQASREPVSNRPGSEKLDDILFSLRRENKRSMMGKHKSSRNLFAD
mmetsp:Transcript_102160/g.153051  ORF Transcript_102160/g.153051 Transcript_102160/m.153051 type:complete len:830 (+) Transcript_102160:11-2500(+)